VSLPSPLGVGINLKISLLWLFFWPPLTPTTLLGRHIMLMVELSWLPRAGAEQRVSDPLSGRAGEASEKDLGMILAGDIGGTNARLASFEATQGHLTLLVEETFPSHAYASLGDIVRTFISAHDLRVTHACFGIAGPIQRGRSEAINLAWVVDAQQLAQQLGLATVWLINDLEANAYGVAAIAPEDFVILNEGTPEAEGNAAVIAAGTGLGEAGLYWDGKQHLPFASEGGHASFAPDDALQVELLQYLQQRFTHVSWERVLSGPGLYNVYTFLRDTQRGVEPAWLTEELRQVDPPAAIAGAALAGTCDLCVQALDLCVALYGAEAGNLALKVMATGGVFVGGGIAPKIVAKLQEPTFMRAFCAKGRLQPVLAAMPVRVIMNDKTALYGAARCAALRAAML
jgi:glucokinase